MKIKLLFFLSILTISYSYAQTKERITAITKACNSSDLIIEGTVVSKDSAFQASNGVVYTPYNVNIISTIFGQVRTTNIQILMKGGDIVTKEGLELSTVTLHSYYLLKNRSSIIFLIKNDISGHPNAYILEDQVVFSSANEVAKTNALSRHYSDVNTMLKEMSDVLGINIPQKKAQK
jgi:hypothetical protein